MSDNLSQNWDLLKGLSLDDAISKMANSVVDFAFKIVVAVAVFYIGGFLIRKILAFIHNVMSSRRIDASLAGFVRSFTRIVLYFILVVTVVGILGIETSSFLALFASAGVAIGMALSGTLQNFAGGVLILLLKPYKVGEYIETQGYAGSVNEIQMFHTVITTPDNKTILIPNGVLSTSSINNYTRQPLRRVEWSVGLQYGDSFERASTVILDVLAADPRVIRDDSVPHPFVGICALADSSVNLTVRAWTKSADYWDLYFDIYSRLYSVLPMHNLHFPFPQLDVHLASPLSAPDSDIPS